MSAFTFTTRRLAKDGIPEQLHSGSPVTIAWSNIDPESAVGTSPIVLLLRLLTSTGTPGANGPYDVYKAGIGLGIPEDQIDVAGIEAIEEELDWDPDQQLFFLITEPESTKRFIDQEICAPFGLYLVTGNDGKIRCVRPRHPQKFYIGDENRRLAFNHVADEFIAELPIGVFDAYEMCANITRAMLQGWDEGSQEYLNDDFDHPVHRFKCSYIENKFKIWKETLTWDEDEITNTEGDEFDLEVSPDNGWNYLGWTTQGVTVPEAGRTADVARGAFTGETLNQDDLWGIQLLDNPEDRITRVSFSCDYDVDKEKYNSGITFPETPSDYEHLEDSFGATEHRIYSRGLITGGEGSPAWVTQYVEPEEGCDADVMSPAEELGVNAATWSKLIAYTYIDRYREPPLKFRAQLKWKWNGLEVGDVVKVNYSIPGVFVDRERGKDVLEDRLFEIVELHPNFDGSLDVTFLGHRYVSY